MRKKNFFNFINFYLINFFISFLCIIICNGLFRENRDRRRFVNRGGGKNTEYFRILYVLANPDNSSQGMIMARIFSGNFLAIRRRI